jgi:hypothetical protein
MMIAAASAVLALAIAARAEQVLDLTVPPSIQSTDVRVTIPAPVVTLPEPVVVQPTPTYTMSPPVPIAAPEPEPVPEPPPPQDGVTIPPGQSIAAFVNAHSATSFRLSAGDYQGGVISRAGITIAGGAGAAVRSALTVAADGVTLDGTRHDNAPVEIRARNTVIRNGTFTNWAMTSTAKAIWVRETGDYSGTLIENNTFDHWGKCNCNGASAIKVSDGVGARFAGTVIRNNRFTDGPTAGNAAAIQLFAPTLAEGNVIDGCSDAFEVKGGGMTILRNTVKRCVGGEVLSNRVGAGNRWEGNCAIDNRHYGFTIGRSDNNVYLDNLVMGTASTLSYTGSCIFFSSFGDAAGPGKSISGRFEGNWCVRNQRGVHQNFRDIPPDGIHFEGNVFVGPGRLEFGQTVTAAGNTFDEGFAPFGASPIQRDVTDAEIAARLAACTQ